MNTDRELLELAAKAAGVFLTPETLKQALPKWEWDADFEPYHLKNGGMCGGVLSFNDKGELGGTTSKDWNPLARDGDALRLAVKLNMVIGVVPSATKDGNATIACAPGAGNEFAETHGDPYAATRRAIVRAAAEIGRSMA
jgi:hypothetical protein